MPNSAFDLPPADWGQAVQVQSCPVSTAVIMISLVPCLKTPRDQQECIFLDIVTPETAT